MFEFTDFLMAVFYAWRAYRVRKMTDKLYDGKLAVEDIFICVGTRRIPEKDIILYDGAIHIEHIAGYYRLIHPLPYYYNLADVVNLSSHKAIKNLHNLSSVAIVHAHYLDDAIGEAEYCQLNH